MYENTDTLGYLIPDSVQTATLQQIAGDNSLFPGAWSRNILISSGLLDYTEPIVFTSNLKSSRKEKYHWTSKGSPLSALRVFPNPARDFIIIEYQNHESSAQAVVDFIDVNGKCIKFISLPARSNQMIIPTEGLPSGSYLIQFRINDSVQKVSKVIIIR